MSEMTEEQYDGVRQLIIDAYIEGASRGEIGGVQDDAMNHCTRVTEEFLKLFPTTPPAGYVLVPVEPTEVHFIFPSELTNEIVDTWREVFSIIPKSEYSNAMDYAAMAYGALKRYARAKAAQQPIGGE